MSCRRQKGLIIAIDGPSGAGKSTVTRLLAKRLGYIYIDTGAMFRAMALAVKRAAVPLEDDQAVDAVCCAAEIRFVRTNGCCHVMLNGEDVSAAIRTPEISLLTSAISARKRVREILLELQRDLACDGGVILEGRDIGTVVFPDADLKFFLSASASERGKRRFDELKSKGEDVTLDQTIQEVIQRDAQDERREHAPLRRAEDALDLDSTGLSVEEVLEIMVKEARLRMDGRQDRIVEQEWK